MYPLERYLRDLHEIRSTGAGVKEASYYPSLANLLNAVGQTLKPHVRCVINLANVGAGIPDGGLFTPDQFQRGTEEPLHGQRTVAGTLKNKGEDALLGAHLKAAATERVFGFEILPAPFVVAHLQMGLLLQAEGIPLDEGKKERAGIYLTNALTGWETPRDPGNTCCSRKWRKSATRRRT